jgi:hypothetical protein
VVAIYERVVAKMDDVAVSNSEFDKTFIDLLMYADPPLGKNDFSININRLPWLDKFAR